MNSKQGKVPASIMAKKCSLYLKEASEEELELISKTLESRNDTKRALKILKLLVEQANPQADHQKIFHVSVDKLTKSGSNPVFKKLIDDLILRADERIQNKSIKSPSESGQPTPEELLSTINASTTGDEKAIFWSIQLPHEDSPRVFEYVEVEPEDIDAKTEIIEIHNGRFQRDTTALNQLAELISLAGQVQPAFAYWPEGADKASVLDGSRRRIGCKKAGKKFRMFFTREELSESQIEFLSTIFESQEGLSYLEKAATLALRFLSAQAYAEKHNKKLSRNKFAEEQQRFKKSHVYNVIDHGCISKEFFTLFPNLDLCTQNWCNTQLMPLVNKVIDSGMVQVKGKSDNDRFEAIFEASSIIAKNIAECRKQITTNNEIWEDTFHIDALRYVESTMFNESSKNDESKKKRKTPKLSYVAGKNTRSKNWIRQTTINDDEPYQASVKITDPKVKKAFAKMIESFAQEHNL